MTVQELIEKLQQITDKDQEILVLQPRSVGCSYSFYRHLQIQNQGVVIA